jgi:hypothetical protein
MNKTVEITTGRTWKRVLGACFERRRFCWLGSCLLVLAANIVLAESSKPPSPSASTRTPTVKTANYPVMSLPTEHVYPSPIVGDSSQEKRGVVWLDNHRVMFRGVLPGKFDTHGLYIWDTVTNTVSQYSNHTTLCYADGYIKASGPGQKRDDAQGSTIIPNRYGRLGEEKNGSCDSLTRSGCQGPLNMSCKPIEYPRGHHPLGDGSSIALQLRSGDGILVNTYPDNEVPYGRGIEAVREFYSQPTKLVNKRYPQGKALPFIALEKIETRRVAYSDFVKRYVFIPSRPTNGQPGLTTNWPEGRPQPVYLMNAEGEVETIRIPSRPEWRDLMLALPSVPGLVFEGAGGPARDWGGLFLYDKKDVWLLDRGKMEALAVSPDGCKVAYAIINRYGQTPINHNRIKIIHFCKREQ